jgi:C1A family cysteine protease
VFEAHRIFNVQPSKQDYRDWTYKAVDVPVKQEVDLRAYDSPVEEQGRLGACVAHAVTSCYENMVRKNDPEQFAELSRLFNYYNTRMLEETVGYDYGVQYIRNSLKALKQWGICKEELWPYDPTVYTIKPSQEAYEDAQKRIISSYEAVPTIQGMHEILSNGQPIVIGMEVFDSFYTVGSDNPEVPIPDDTEYTLGGHAVLLVGYSIPQQIFIAKNSFGTDWGEKGYCYISNSYIEDYAFDRWRFDYQSPSSIYKLMQAI